MIYRYFKEILAGFLLVPLLMQAQVNVSSQANWKYPGGNASATKYIEIPSEPQVLDSLAVKWSTGLISGDVKPLIGNIVDNPPLRSGFNAPNEIAAVMGDKIIVIDGLGKIAADHKFPSEVIGINELSCLIDTIGTASGRTKLLGFATRETQYPDSVARAYIGGYDHETGKIRVYKKLAVDLSDFDPNVFASIRPVYGKKTNGETFVFATVNTSQPEADDPFPVTPPFFRGITLFNTGTFRDVYPLPDIFDEIDSRVTLGPEVPLQQPSIDGDFNDIALPLYPTPDININIQNFITFETASDLPYLIGFDISGTNVSEGVFNDVSAFMEQRPMVKPYYVDIIDNNTGTRGFILLAEQYSGIEGSEGTSRLHLYDKEFGDAITAPPGDLIEPPYTGTENHHWSVAVGNLDGNADNEWLPYFPNNNGNELIVTQSTREFVYPSSRLSVLKYNSGPGIEKPTGANEFLYPFDTVATERINGWIAGVNDLDGADDGKDEILLVDGSDLRIIRMRDYESVDFRLGMPFDTVATYRFGNQTISQAEIADLEGDGRNDIVVTTFDSTYVIGTLLNNTLIVTSPKDNPQQPVQYCAADTVELQWRNIIRGYKEVDLRFIPFENGFPQPDSSYIIAEGIDNQSDTVNYSYKIAAELAGKNGIIQVESSQSPEMINDRTDFLEFLPPSIAPSPPFSDTYHSGEEIILTGNTGCADSVSVEYFDIIDSAWVEIGRTNTLNDSYILTAELPCLEIFRCETSDLNDVLDLRLIAEKENFADTTNPFGINFEPALLPLVIEENETADPTKYFSWDTTDIEFPCDTIAIYASTDNGNTYALLDIMPAETQEYTWNVRLDLPDDILMRFCCVGSCVRRDTILNDFKPQYINIVAPNPFRPPLEDVEIVYQVDENTNVTMRIVDNNNSLVRELINNEPRNANTAYTERWDGRLSNGSLAANGMYYIILEMSTGRREMHPVFLRK